MNMKTTLAALSLLSVVSFGASAATLITNDQANNLQSVGTITASGVTGAPSDIRQALSDKADKQGAKAYRVIEAYENGNWHATAEIYK
ncbi:peroxide/acid stress response protein YhcN [Pseudomonas lundensis]|uniref:peroxide/acid stress response protein YhcN n=1 Tax=Serratia proteamaculans TaxID=28151 RepID=UPI002981D9E3|nr:peroxide/acid stress response protein YhcN [Serratia proteamaculans]MDW5502314.1 peroxide/acid stress response protein YhcN [Serratia proteamaculans]MDW5507372.1 peroxide/acid stress response protein YhcN [Pseudomonas lundensis]